ncbi:unnamed protein product [Rotaria sp. Silwood2]|nr:unnamed protein product [Rotaria sp. Silwood2]CAF2836336.1 unnamed protein product [Rotaria sp. Silwood2]CAF3253361.1 unnamed protein product [Rotaria sp. Silwood2]CAF4273517.1 unnamed protein product [Rotaria sp. Silwood2]CAF4510594.1 unnamed protein product [Rotaria sp. Silwood2]
MSGRFYHGNPNRDNKVWVYPQNKPLINSRLDTYNANGLYNNYTYVGLGAGPKIQAYPYNGHKNASVGGTAQHLVIQEEAC